LARGEREKRAFRDERKMKKGSIREVESVGDYGRERRGHQKSRPDREENGNASNNPKASGERKHQRDCESHH